MIDCNCLVLNKLYRKLYTMPGRERERERESFKNIGDVSNIQKKQQQLIYY